MVKTWPEAPCWPLATQAAVSGTCQVMSLSGSVVTVLRGAHHSRQFLGNFAAWLLICLKRGFWRYRHTVLSSRESNTATGALSRPPTPGWKNEHDESLTQLTGAEDCGRAPGAPPLDVVCVVIGRTHDSTDVAFRGKFTFKCHLTRSVGMPVDVQAGSFFILSVDVKLLPPWCRAS